MAEYRARAKRAKTENANPGPSFSREEQQPPHDDDVDVPLQPAPPASPSVHNVARPDFMRAGPSSDANIDPVLLADQHITCPNFAPAGPSSPPDDTNSGPEDHPSSPLSSPPSSPRRSTSSHSLPLFDLVSGVRGVQVPESAQSVEWPGGLTTVLPTLVRDDKNYLVYDASHVSFTATYPQATPDSRYIDFLDAPASNDDGYDIVLAIRKSLSHGRPVVVRKFDDTSSFTFTEDGLRRRFGISPNMLLDIHGTIHRLFLALTSSHL